MSSAARSLQAAIETDEMWLQLQTDLKEAIGSVWTVMGYPEHCRGAGYNNEMHLFVSHRPPPPPSLLHFPEDDWAVDLSTAAALSVEPGPYNSRGRATCCAEGVCGSPTNPKVRTMSANEVGSYLTSPHSGFLVPLFSSSLHHPVPAPLLHSLHPPSTLLEHCGKHACVSRETCPYLDWV